MRCDCEYEHIREKGVISLKTYLKRFLTAIREPRSCISYFSTLFDTPRQPDAAAQLRHTSRSFFNDARTVAFVLLK